MSRQIDIRRFLRPGGASGKADEEPQQHHEEQPTDFSSPEAQAIASDIVTRRQLAAPPPNASLCGVPPEKLAGVCDHMPTLEAIRLALINKTMEDTCRSPFVTRQLIITPATHKLWRRASRAVLRQLRGRLTHLQTAAITTDDEVYSRGPDIYQDRPGDDAASDDGREEENDAEAEGTEEVTAGRGRALGHRGVYAKVLEGSAASLRNCRLEDKTTTASVSPVTDSPRPPRVTFGKIEEVVLCGALWQGAAHDRRWSLPALKTLVSSSFSIAPRYLMSWIEASPHLTHLHVRLFGLPFFTYFLSAAPSLTNLTSLGCILLTETNPSSWEPLLSVLEAKGAVGRIETLGVCLDVVGLEPDGILTILRALDTAIRRLAGLGISAADTQVTAIPVTSWDDNIMTNVVNQPHHQVDSGASQSSSSAAAVCEPSVGGGRRAPLFPNMVPTNDHDDDASGEMADKKPAQRPFKLLVYVPSSFDERLLRLDLTDTDVLAKKIIREMARVAESMKVKTVSGAAPAARGSFGNYVFESLTELTIEDSLAVTNGVLPSLPAAPCNRFPRLQSVDFLLPSIHLVREGGVRELVAPVKGQLKRAILCLADFPSRYDTSYGTGQPPPSEAAPGLLAQLALECLDVTGHVDQVGLSFLPTQPIGAFRPETCPINHPFTTPELAARLPSTKKLVVSIPYCVHDRFGDVQTDFIMTVINNTPDPERVIFSEDVTQDLVSFNQLQVRHSPAYLASGAVDGALASAGSPFVVVKTDDTELTLEQ
ncbi:unnamed protein product [Vitrella brassicaformis CCMP3155]|uniref:Uncharacterized protein n=1 Tax=Vitrella brassicaformis (strain CCMP3155) TaxID=1169540 RepID=A0A0G4GI13_VITBC|nr:unnamed protein product [Vitrella brassicaformis CCMP3155]|eukprot:CEM29367.1 unnamed protein product [Vitrella brassicaformis CCMP3155]